MFKKLRIRAYPKSGIISDQYLPLDGILFYHLVRREMGEQIVTKPGECLVQEDDNLKLPILQIKHENDTWFYSCSFAQWSSDVAEDHTFKVKQGDWLRYGHHHSENKRINIASGKYKNYHIKIYYRHCSFIDWYCVGDPMKIAELLRFCTHIGKNAGDGWGEVLHWEIQEWPDDWSIRGDGNRLMRAMPDRNSNFLYGIRPSYWDARNIVPCKMPG